MTLPAELDQQLREVSCEVNLDLQKTVETLLRYGLRSHREKQAKLEDLLERFRSEPDPAKQNLLGDELGRAIFG